MSMDRCTKCADLVDTDFDCEFYDFSYLVNDMGGHCEQCREDIYENLTEFEQIEHEKRTYG